MQCSAQLKYITLCHGSVVMTVLINNKDYVAVL